MIKKPLATAEYGDSSADETVVLLHGLFGSAKNLAGIARHLEPTFRVVSFDLPNHGGSPHVSVMSIRSMADQIAGEIRRRCFGNVNLLGHSLGGKVAMSMALANPKMVNRLIVADIAPVIYKPHHDDIFAAMRAVPLDDVRSRGEAEQYMAKFIHEPAIRQFLLQNLQKNC